MPFHRIYAGGCDANHWLTSVSHAFSLLNFCDVNVRSECCELTLALLKHFIEWSFLVTVYETAEVANLAFELHFTGRSIALNYGPIICISFLLVIVQHTFEVRDHARGRMFSGRVCEHLFNRVVNFSSV